MLYVYKSDPTPQDYFLIEPQLYQLYLNGQIMIGGDNFIVPITLTELEAFTQFSYDLDKAT